MNEDLDKLEVGVGDPITAEHENELLRSIKRRTIQGGNGVLISQFDDHVQVSYRAPWVPGARHAWKPVMTSLDGKAALRFARGLINGIEPQIDGNDISDEAVKPLLIPGYDDAGDCYIYAEIALDLQSWAITSATMIASATTPKFKPFVARKLIAIVSENGTIERRCFFDLGFAASNRKSNGVFRSWWFLGKQGGVL